jgi:hypothetical protein
MLVFSDPSTAVKKRIEGRRSGRGVVIVQPGFVDELTGQAR